MNIYCARVVYQISDKCQGAKLRTSSGSNLGFFSTIPAIGVHKLLSCICMESDHDYVRRVGVVSYARVMKSMDVKSDQAEGSHQVMVRSQQGKYLQK